MKASAKNHSARQFPCGKPRTPFKAEAQEARTSPASPDRLTMNVEQMRIELGISRSTAYELIQKPDFPSFTIGRRVLISREGLKKWIEKQCLTKDPEVLQTVEK